MRLAEWMQRGGCLARKLHGISEHTVLHIEGRTDDAVMSCQTRTICGIMSSQFLSLVSLIVPGQAKGRQGNTCSVVLAFFQHISRSVRIVPGVRRIE